MSGHGVAGQEIERYSEVFLRKTVYSCRREARTLCSVLVSCAVPAICSLLDTDELHKNTFLLAAVT